MLFLSHNYQDKPVVEEFAVPLAKAFGQEKVFYDSWSIQPGDGIIDKMNEGLTNCKLFLFFVSKNSLASNMVKLEWQNAVYKATKGDTKIVPVKLDDCMMPPVLMQSVYVDPYSNGLDVAVRQIVDIAHGKNIFIPGLHRFSNLQHTMIPDGNDLIIEIRATQFMEPISRFIVLIENGEGELEFRMEPDQMHTNGFNANVQLSDGRVVNGHLMALERATTPNYPFKMRIRPLRGISPRIVGVLHEFGLNDWRPVHNS